MNELTTVQEAREAANRLAKTLFETSDELPLGTMLDPTSIRTTFTLEEGLLLIMTDGKVYRVSNTF